MTTDRLDPLFTPRSAARPAGVLIDAAVHAVERLAARVDLSVSRRAIRRAIALHTDAPDHDLWDVWAGRALAAAPAVGLRVERRALSVHEILQSGSGALPLVGVALGREDLAPVEIVQVASSRAAVVLPERLVWLRADELSALLGVDDAHERAPFLVPESSAPLAACASTAPGGATPFARLRGLLRLEREDAWTAVLYAVGVGVVSLAAPIGAQSLVSTVAFGGLIQPLVVLTVLVLVGLAAAALLRAMHAWVVERIQQRVFARLAMDLAHRLPRVPPSALAGEAGPELATRFLEVANVQKGVAMLLVDGVGVGLATLVGLILLAFYHPALLALDVLIVASLLVLLFGPGKTALATAIKESKEKYAVTAWLQEIVRRRGIFGSTSGAELAWSRTDDLVRGYLAARQKHFKALFRQVVGALAIQAIASAALLGVGGWLVITGKLTLGQLVAAELVVTLVVAGIAKLGKYLETYYDLLAGIDKVGQLLDVPLEPSGGVPVSRAEAPASVELEDVSVDALGDGRAIQASLRIAAGARAVIVGASGAGKSALMDVLAAARPPTSGRLRVDGVDARALDVGSVRDRVVLLRAPEVFAGSVLENVACGRADVGLADASAALGRVGLLAAIERLPQGLQTPLSSGGPELSEAARCLLMVARAVAARPRVLVVDAGFDALDARARARVWDALLDRAAPWTLIAASRDGALASRVDRAFALEDGSLREIGSAS